MSAKADWLTKCLRTTVLRLRSALLALLFTLGCSERLSHPTLSPGARRMVDWWAKVGTIDGAILMTIVSLALVAQLAISRWRKLTVFISFFHENEDVAERLETFFKQRRTKVLRLLYQPRRHDEVILKVRELLLSSDMMIVIPGPNRSFVDAEILAAAVLKKPVTFIKIVASDTRPDTAFSGYPVFGWQLLNAKALVPLARFVSYACNHWTDAFRNCWRAISEVYTAVFALAGGCMLTLGVVDSFDWLLYLVSPSLYFMIRVVLGSISAIVFTILTVIIFPLSMIQKWQAIRVAKQTLITGTLTFRILSNGLSSLRSDQAVIECLEKAPLMERGS